MSRLAAGQVDVIVGFAHMRAKYAANWMSKFGGQMIVINRLQFWQ